MVPFAVAQYIALDVMQISVSRNDGNLMTMFTLTLLAMILTFNIIKLVLIIQLSFFFPVSTV